MSPEEYATNEMLKDEIADVLLTLTEREEKVIRLRFGLEDGKSTRQKKTSIRYALNYMKLKKNLVKPRLILMKKDVLLNH